MAESDNDSGGNRDTINNNRSNNHESNSHREQDRLLPIANVSRIMKKGLPANAKISKDAKETVQECVSEFISFITGEASDKCQLEKRKTINGDDLLWAMTTLGFEEYVDPLKVYLQKFRDMEGEKCAMAGGSGAGGGGGGGKQDREVGHRSGSGNVVNMVNSGVGYVREGGATAFCGGGNGMRYQHQHIHPHQGHVYVEDLYGSSGTRRPGKVGPGYVGSNTNATR